MHSKCEFALLAALGYEIYSLFFSSIGTDVFVNYKELRYTLLAVKVLVAVSFLVLVGSYL